MKKIKYLGMIVLTFILLFFGMSILVNVLNSDLYGRLIETKSYEVVNSEKGQNDKLPTITLILHKYLNDENSIEASIVINYQRQQIFENYNHDRLNFIINITDGYNYTPIGLLSSFSFIDSTKRETLGYFYSGFESERFQLPIAPSLNGFPYDNIQVLPLVDLYVNGVYSKFNFQIQKRIPGRILSINNKDSRIIELTRTPTEKYLVMISSIIFLILTILLTYGLFTSKTGLNTIEELIAVASYILATAGFKDMIGITNNNGTSALEIFVILVPLLCVFSGLIYSVLMAKRNRIMK